jgi:hypothetical protein
MNDKFWKDDPKILISRERLIEVFPTKDMTLSEKMNAITRLVVYSSFTLSLYKKNIKFMYIALFIMGIMVFVSENNTKEYFKADTECTKPTKNNPFMNVLMSDYNGSEKPPGCPHDSEIKKLIEENFDFNLYKDSDDLFSRNNSQRQFYTNPSTTIPNDQESFAKWLYKPGTTCKEDSIKCPKNINERLQSKKFIFPEPENNPETQE